MLARTKWAKGVARSKRQRLGDFLSVRNCSSRLVEARCERHRNGRRRGDQRLDVAIVGRAPRQTGHTPRDRGSDKAWLRLPSAHGQVHGIHLVGPLALRPAAFCGNEFDAYSPGKSRGDLVLHLEDVAARLVKTLGPEVRARFRVDKLRVDPDAVGAALHAPFHHVVHTEFAADHAGVHWLALEGEGGVARDDEGARNARQVGCEAFGDTIDEVVLLAVATEVDEGQDNDGEPRCDGRVQRRRLRVRG